MFRSAGGGVCDCGDTTVMNSTGFCTRHGPHRIPNASIPLDFIQTAKFIIPQLLNRLIEHLRTFSSPGGKSKRKKKIFSHRNSICRIKFVFHQCRFFIVIVIIRFIR